MTPAARVQAAIEVLDSIIAGLPSEKALTNWARRARFAGSKDRAAIRDHVFDVVRRWRSCAALGGGETGRARMLGLLRGDGVEPDTLFTGEGHAPAPLTPDERAAGHAPDGAAACDIPDWLWPQWCESLGDRAHEVADTLRHRAPVMLRVNTAKTARDTVRAMLQAEGITTRAAAISPTALIVTDGARRVAQSDAYRDGLIELQDGASQALVDVLCLPTHGKILDFCAGGGGKTLAIAPRTEADLFAHDANPARMKDLAARADRAGARITTLSPDRVAKQAPFDLVLVDAPCSGSGAWRRAPDGKWALNADRLAALTHTQDTILDTVAPLVAPGGGLAYATCSVLSVENEARVARFVRDHPTWRLEVQHSWLPGDEGDGFFVAILASATHS